MAILFLLLAILILALIVLFMPIKYNVQISYVDEKLTYNVKISWLFRLIYMQVKHSDTEDTKLFKIAWKRLLDDVDNGTHSNDGPAGEEEKTKERDPPKNVLKENPKNNEKKAKISLIDRVKDLYNKIVAKIKGFYSTIKNFNDLNINFRELLRDIMLSLKRLLLALKPKVFLLDLELGLDTPDITGIAIGALAALEESIEASNRKKYKIIIKGNFEEKAFHLKSSFMGNFSLWHGIWPFIRLYFSRSMKPIRKIVTAKLFRDKKTRRSTNGQQI